MATDKTKTSTNQHTNEKGEGERVENVAPKQPRPSTDTAENTLAQDSICAHLAAGGEYTVDEDGNFHKSNARDEQS